MVISRSDFDVWMSDPVTKAFKTAMAESISQVKETLAFSAGINSTEDSFHRGYIAAMRDSLDFRVDDLEEF